MQQKYVYMAPTCKLPSEPWHKFTRNLGKNGRRGNLHLHVQYEKERAFHLLFLPSSKFFAYQRCTVSILYIKSYITFFPIVSGFYFLTYIYQLSRIVQSFKSKVPCKNQKQRVGHAKLNDTENPYKRRSLGGGGYWLLMWVKS